MQRFLYEQDYKYMVERSGGCLEEEIRELEGKLEDNGYIYRNKPFKLYPRVVILSSSDRELIRNDSEKLIDILEKVIRIYEKDEITQHYFMLEGLAAKLVAIKPGYKRNIRISRFDTYLVNSGDVFKVLENNTDCPAGVIFTSRVNEVLRQIPSLSSYIKKLPPLHEEGIHKPDSFINELISTFYEFSNGSKLRSVAILQVNNNASLEVKEMVKLLHETGIQSVVADPRNLKYQDGKLYAGHLQIELLWNKINTVDFAPLLTEPEKLTDLISACMDQTVCHVNSFQARFITESKLCMSYLSEPDFRKHFTKDEISLLDKHIPWARKLSGVYENHNGETWNKREYIKLNREKLVLKTAYDIRGEGVDIGLSTSQEQWEKLIDQSWDGPYIVQELVTAPEIQVPIEKNNALTSKKFSADFFMFGGLFQGFGSKLSDELKVNVFQGGSKQAIFSIRDSAEFSKDNEISGCISCGKCSSSTITCS
ncbi:hypothetical protein J2T13_000710 [Paenibacillus sp. DS2015]|uniref:hypothetical protein n=1 Tax=Paenibacillus sp. DS2015 TaxID=3373917 RepID=UPI003D1E3AAC